MRSARLALLAALGPLVSLALALPASAVTIDWVAVGDPGNAVDTLIMSDNSSGYGSVAYPYRISKFETTNAQYAEFLNAVDPTGTNTLRLYNVNMSSDIPFGPFGGIDFVSGNAAGSKYVVKPNRGAKPVNYVSFYDALRFVNWLHNKQGTGDTESGAYTLLGGTPTPIAGSSITRNPGATIFLPSEDEWYKAAYYDAVSMSYNQWSFANNSVATCEVPSGTTSHSANCAAGANGVNDVTDVGAYTSSPSAYGTFDQGGNVWEWNEAHPQGGEDRGIRGGGFNTTGSSLRASTRPNVAASGEGNNRGFRVASLPEPGTGLLVACGLVGVAAARRRRGA